MTIAVVLIVLGAIALYGGIKGYSITDLIFGNKTPRTPPQPISAGSSSPPVTGTSGGNTGGSTGGISNRASPISPSAKFERVDQGVDYQQPGNYLSIGAGIVTDIASGWAGGTGKAVYIRLNNPINWNGRRYDGYYVAETSPLVKKGQRVEPGQPVASGGSAELGFLINGYPTPLEGSIGKGTRPTQAGYDFLAFVKKVSGQ